MIVRVDHQAASEHTDNYTEIVLTKKYLADITLN
jgi:hypothetical protein